MPKYGDECPPIREFDVYTGCPFRCLYCIGADRHEAEPRLSENYASVLGSPISDLPLYLSPWTDPYPPEEENNRHTRRLLEHLSGSGQPFFAVTKNPLVRRDADLFRGNDRAFVAVSINTMDDSITQMLEPDAPPASSRIELIEDLVSIPNLRTVVRIDPIIPSVTDGVVLDRLLGWLCEIRPFAVAIETLRVNCRISLKLKTALPDYLFRSIISSYAEIGEKAAHPRIQWRQMLFRHAASKLAASDVRACFCRATLPERITPWDCRGGY
jgi:DNA repair photolyase